MYLHANVVFLKFFLIWVFKTFRAKVRFFPDKYTKMLLIVD